MYDRNNLEWHKESTIEVFAIIKSLFLKEWISCIAKFRMPDITKASTSLLEQTGNTPRLTFNQCALYLLKWYWPQKQCSCKIMKYHMIAKSRMSNSSKHPGELDLDLSYAWEDNCYEVGKDPTNGWPRRWRGDPGDGRMTPQNTLTQLWHSWQLHPGTGSRTCIQVYKFVKLKVVEQRQLNPCYIFIPITET